VALCGEGVGVVDVVVFGAVGVIGLSSKVVSRKEGNWKSTGKIV